MFSCKFRTLLQTGPETSSAKLCPPRRHFNNIQIQPHDNDISTYKDKKDTASTKTDTVHYLQKSLDV